uniref:Interleukin 10 receptor, alpha n=1 Tax=Mus musculus TaxID=10090 RepID=H3BKE8_MOUSE
MLSRLLPFLVTISSLSLEFIAYGTETQPGMTSISVERLRHCPVISQRSPWICITEAMATGPESGQWTTVSTPTGPPLRLASQWMK